MFTPIIGTLGYVMSPDQRQVLLVERTRAGDEQRGKYNGLGGKLESGEDVVAGFLRELEEEAGIVPTKMSLRGTISWPGFGAEGADWFGFIFRVDAFQGTPPDRNEDGPLIWADVERLDELPMWEGDRHFLPLVFADNEPFHGVMPYESGRPVGWTYHRV
ncbi:MAG: 8-oxo-dGTP diphosphatase [Propionibacteriaceae bacterium]|jgi:8-oxo-dGTP diphosphatase|nr:8-oxo-dGTP diphosphatase [Propionibacteriaceae bacterium]